MNLLSRLLPFKSGRIMQKWNNEISQNSNYWIIPQVRQRFNYKVSGDVNISYEDYFCNKYLSNKDTYTMLSVGCGVGWHERNFAKHEQIKSIIAVDISEERINIASELSKEPEYKKIKYICMPFHKEAFLGSKFDIIHFSSSLHHFSEINEFIAKQILPLLNKDGYLVFQEYTGKNRLQYSKKQLKICNRLLTLLPNNYRLKTDKVTYKNKVYAPGLLRMLLSDPSEAPDSESILPACNQLLKPIQIKYLGGDILMPLLKDIAHNFTDNTQETDDLLDFIFSEEDKYIIENAASDNSFAVFQV